MFRPVSAHTPEVSIRTRDAVFLQAASLTEVAMSHRFAATIRQTHSRKKKSIHLYSSPLIFHLHLFANKGLLPWDSNRMMCCQFSSLPRTPHHRAGDTLSGNAQPWKREVRQASWVNVMKGDNNSPYQSRFAISIYCQPCHSPHGTPLLITITITSLSTGIFDNDRLPSTQQKPISMPVVSPQLPD